MQTSNSCAVCRNCTEYPSGCYDCIVTDGKRSEDDYRETIADAERDEQ